jgi:hypothetical protein
MALSTIDGGFIIRRDSLEKVFGDDHEAIIQMELLLEQMDDFVSVGIPAENIVLDTANFNGVLSSLDTNVQLAFETVDDITTTDVPEGDNFYYTEARFDTSFAAKDTDDLSEGVVNLYYTDARVAEYIEGNILEYGFESVSASVTVTKTKTVFTGSTPGQTITLPTAGTDGREVEVFNNGTVQILISGSSVLSELFPDESACFTDTGVTWIA